MALGKGEQRNFSNSLSEQKDLKKRPNNNKKLHYYCGCYYYHCYHYHYYFGSLRHCVAQAGLKLTILECITTPDLFFF
jgi:hypothetical protein